MEKASRDQVDVLADTLEDLSFFRLENQGAIWQVERVMKVNDSVLQKGTALFETMPSALHSLGGIDGAVYDFERDGQAYIIKYVPTTRDRIGTTCARWRFVDYLATNGVPVVRPVLSRDGDLFHLVEDQARLYVVFCYEKVPGGHAKWDGGTAANDLLFEAWGQVMGRMHALTKSYDGGAETGGWQEEHASFADWCKDDGIRAKWLELGQYLETLPQDVDSYGLIHNDLHPQNFVVSYVGDQPHITVIDFEVCNNHWFACDIATALYPVAVRWVRSPDKNVPHLEFAQRAYDHFMIGYRQENQIDNVWLARLPQFLSYRRMLLHIVFTDEWQEGNSWQERVLREWRRGILNDTPVLDIRF
jgi:Ser/Thr protein kinase RdoA (MazF antagonist)